MVPLDRERQADIDRARRERSIDADHLIAPAARCDVVRPVPPTTRQDPCMAFRQRAAPR